jgi:alpha-mannosidase
LISTAFERLPGTAPGAPLPGETVVLLGKGVDFFWKASDGSQVFAHWLPVEAGWQVFGYGLGSNLDNGSDQGYNISTYLATFNANGSANPPYSASPSGNLYVPNDNDFEMPITDLLSAIDQWNSPSNTSQYSYNQTGVWLTQASFDDFVSVMLSDPTALPTPAFVPIPYWTGYYMSRPGLKVLHYNATRYLLAAEVFGLLANQDASYWAQVTQAWNDFAPSTHHDYVCGTASDPVYQTEQLPKLQTANTDAESAAQAGLTALASSISPSGDNGVVVANPAGVDFNGAVELAAPVPDGMLGIQFGSDINYVQATAGGGLIFPVSAPSMGYTTGYLTSGQGTISPAAQIGTPDQGATYILDNGVLTVTVNATANWGIVSIVDSAGNSLLASGGVGNDLVFYEDGGDIYEFGNEYVASGYQEYSTFQVQPWSVVNASVQMLEQGPVRVRLQTIVTLQIAGANANQSYTREYCLIAGEPFLRMTTTGAAPSGFSVMTAFPLWEQVTSINHGTPCHWTSVQPQQNWPLPIFQATQNFVLPQGSGGTLAAIYHQDVPAWAYDDSGTLLGCLLRNTPGGPHGAHGTDFATHTLDYAFRTPSGLGDPASAQPLAEALQYTMPVMAALVQQGSSSLPETAWLARCDAGPGILLAAKPGDVTPGALVLRLYQPTNAPQTSLTIALGSGQPAQVTAVTALEDPIGAGAPAIQITSTGFTIEVATALNTVEVTF